MERSVQERATGIPNFVSYNPPQLNQESPVKLPLALIISTPPDRRGSATVSTCCGSATFSPTRTPNQNYHQLNSPLPHEPQPQPFLTQKDLIPDPDPATVAGGTNGGATNNLGTDQPPQPHDPPATSSTPTDTIRYKECLKNHAVSLGGHVLDGCGEFMPSGEEGTPEALRCAACDCHRSFHRREADGEPQTGPSHYYTYNPNSCNNNIHRNPVFHSQPQPTMLPRQNQLFTATPPGGRTPPTVVAFGRHSGGAGAESSSEDLNMFRSNARGHGVVQQSFSGPKKRFRTKFSQEQKDRMHEFASRLGWKIQNQDEQELQQFCDEMGVKRQIFKVWMHNNKQNMKKRQM